MRNFLNAIFSKQVFLVLLSVVFFYSSAYGKDDGEQCKKLPYYFSHPQECNLCDDLIDTLIHCYPSYSKERQTQVIDFFIDSFLYKGGYSNIQYFLSQDVEPKSFTKRQKDKLLEITFKYQSRILVFFWGDLQDVSYVKPLREWYKSHQNVEYAFDFQCVLFRLEDEETCRQWKEYMLTEPAKVDTLDDDYFFHFDEIMRYKKNREYFDLLFDVMLKFPDKQMTVGKSYPSFMRNVYEPISMFFYRKMFGNLKGAPEFDYEMMLKNEVERNRIFYYRLPDEYKAKYLGWCKKHLKDYVIEKKVFHFDVTVEEE